MLGLMQMGSAQQMASYYERNPFLRAAAGAFGHGLLGFANPANAALPQRQSLAFYWATEGINNGSIRDWGLFAALPGLGFGVQHQENPAFRVTDYALTLAGGNARSAIGIGYAWSTGNHRVFRRQKRLSLGLLYRPVRQLSLGFVGVASTESNAREGVVEVGLRPLGTPRLTLFGDFALQRGQRLKDGGWSAGAAAEVIPGLNLVGRYFDSEAFTVGMVISFGHSRLSGQMHFDSAQRHRFNTYSVEFGDYMGDLLSNFVRRQYYLEMHLKGRVDYRKYRYLDDETLRFWEILRTLRNAANDDRIEVVALNLSGLRILPEHAWEIRQALQRVRQKGKKVVVFIDNAGMSTYHLASVADRIMMDPQGSLTLLGYRAGRTYLKGTLEKLGLGFDEWRFFKYKSAAEVLSRKEMSPADREQRQAYIDDQYELVRREVGLARAISPAKFDSLVDQQAYFMPRVALEEGLVDTLCRWDALDKVIRSLTGRAKQKLSLPAVNEVAGAHREWSLPPRIALVYAQGVCAMDEGIQARKLNKELRRLARDKSIKAVVFRVDSPGGDGMASDVVAEALKACAEKKPVVVSQGQVAGSGGYWISMYGSKILAGPGTITGSIGVIGGWIYDKGFSDKLGMTSDLVKRGKHADVGFGIRLPLLGVQVPARNLTAEERSKVEKLIKAFYREFVEKVAAGRKMPVERVEALAQGRIYSGIQGKANGLVDEIGGLLQAIDTARELAGIAPSQRIQVVETSPYKGWIKIQPPFGSTRSWISLDSDPMIQFIRLMSERPGFPRPILPPGMYPTLD
ncbi:MAG: signal peptide peptidase SppA [Calditrichaeota bacterium]|nr:MAG: signal peptide peptidase SppA [Calditrichota bacterium]